MSQLGYINCNYNTLYFIKHKQSSLYICMSQLSYINCNYNNSNTILKHAAHLKI